jgi:integrase
MTTELITARSETLAAQELAAAGQAASRAAAAGVIVDYLGRKTANTRRRLAGDVGAFADYLDACQAFAAAGELATFAELVRTWRPTEPAPDLGAWAGVTWGLVMGFVEWQLSEGYAVGAVNVRLCTVKVFCRLATQAGEIPPDALSLIRAVAGYSQAEGRNLDATRETTRRAGSKKAQPVVISPDLAAQLKAQPDTAQGRRDALMMCLLLDHGLRVGELAGLAVTDFDAQGGRLTFYRPKVDKTQTHRLTPDTRAALAAYIAAGDVPAVGLILRASRKGGELGAAGMTERAITARVGELGARVGLVGLSAHDCRHYWASTAARHKTDPFALRDAGGWSSLAMPSRYVEAAKIANEGVRLS